MRRIAAAVPWFAVACLPDPGADLVGLRVVSASWPAFAVQVPVAPVLDVEFSEAPDLDTVDDRHVTMVRWKEVGSCSLTPVCAKGSCRAGRCWDDPLSSSDLSALDRGEPEEDESVPLEIELVAPQRLRIRPATLEPHARYSLVLGAGLRDRSGAGLEDEHGRATRRRFELVTAGEGSAGPEPRLSFPAPGAEHVPTNVAAIETSFARPVVIDDAATLVLAGDDGREIMLVAPRPCDGWVNGHCLAWALDALAPEVAYAVSGGDLRDPHGRTVVRPHVAESFRSALGPDVDPPALEQLELSVRGPCVLVRAHTDESVRAVARLGATSATASASAGIELALRLPADVGTAVVHLSLVDLAGNETSAEQEIDAAQLPVPIPSLVITEVLGNPAGPEPRQELVELANLGPDALELDGLWLVDLPWAAVLGLLAAGDPPGDPLPAVELAPTAIALVVPAAYDPDEGTDVAPAPGTALLRVDASLGGGGLKNAGEPLSLYRADPPTLLSSYGNFVDASPAAHAGRSVVLTRPDACDVAANWRSHPLGQASPGRLP